MQDFFEAVFRMDVNDDVSELVEYIEENVPRDPDVVVFVVFQLLKVKRLRAAFALAMLFSNSGYQHPVVCVALSIGGLLFGIPTEEERGLEGLRSCSLASVMTVEGHATFHTDVLIPLFAHLFEMDDEKSDDHWVSRVFEILKTVIPRFRTRFDWNASVPNVSLEEMRLRGREQANLITYSLPPSDVPCQRRRVVVVDRKFVFSSYPYLVCQPWRPLDVEPRIVAAMNAYGWHAVSCRIDCKDPIDDYRTVIATCRQQNAEILIFDEDFVLTRREKESSRQVRTDIITMLRRDMPSTKLVGILPDAGLIDPNLLTELLPLLDVVLSTTMPSSFMESEPALVTKVLQLPMPYAGSFDAPNRSLVPQMLFVGRATGLDALWLSAADQLNLPIKKKPMMPRPDGFPTLENYALYRRELAEETCYLRFSEQPDLTSPVADFCFETILGGSLLVQEASSDMHRYFVPGEHYLEFSSLAELSSVARFITERREEAEEIRRCGNAFARERYCDEKLVGYLDKFLYFPDQPSERLDIRNDALQTPKRKLVSFEYLSVGKWCEQVPPTGLLAGSGNLVSYFHTSDDFDAVDLSGLSLKGDGYEDLFPYDEASIGSLLHHFDFKSRRIIHHQVPPFVARLENVRIELPSFGVFLDRHLLMEESFHSKFMTNLEANNSFGVYGARREAQFEINVADPYGSSSLMLDVKYYIDYGVNQYEEGPFVLISGAYPSNYHHWMSEMLTRLWCLAAVPELNALPILLYDPLLPFQLETLTALGVSPERIKVFDGKTLHAKTLIFPSYITPESFSLKQISWLRDSLLPAFGVDTTLPPQTLVYVSRAKAGIRRLINEASVVAGLQSRGFQVFFLENMTVKEQLELFNSAKIVVMPHGAAGINMIFAQPGSTLIELYPASYRQTSHLVYALLNKCRYGYFICDDSGCGKGDMIADANALFRAVDKALASC